MIKKNLIPAVLFLILSACASTLHRGVVAMKIDDSTAHVGLSESEVSIGDHVELYTNKCDKIKGEAVLCRKIPKGHGIVTSIISPDYVSVKFDKGVSFQEGDFIEKHSSH